MNSPVMQSSEWHARIECAGQVVGAGFLVTPDKVLTCAHVVHGSAGATVAVSFPQFPASPPVPARIVVHGGWSGGVTDAGDMAVLELDRPVSLAPAAFAPPGAERGSPSPELVAYGFPEGSDEGVLASYRALPGPLILDEWVQLEAFAAHGQPLAAGFSGAAVALADGTVVGMVSAITTAPGVLVGRMLPTRVLQRYWRDLRSMVPQSPRAAADRARLRELVEKAVRAGLECDPVRLYNAAAGDYDPPAPQDGFDSLRSAALFVLCELDGREATDTVTRFADRLEALLGAGDAQGSGPDWSPILVELGPSGEGEGQVRVEVSAFSEGRRHPVASDTVPRARLSAYVQDRIEAAILHLTPGADELITFSLPRDWLHWPVDTWESDPDDELPLGCVHPLVVTDHARRKPTARHDLTKAWNRLDSATGCRMERVECGGSVGPKQLLNKLWQADACLAGFATTPRTTRTRGHFDKSVTAPAPVIAWSRNGCGTQETGEGDACAGNCAGTAFLDRLDDQVADVPPAELPLRVRELRRAAYTTDDPAGHWAEGIQLLWDDPRRFTDPHATAAHSRSPVA